MYVEYAYTLIQIHYGNNNCKLIIKTFMQLLKNIQDDTNRIR